MIKLIMLVRRQTDTGRAAFRHYYQTVHAPLAASLLPAARNLFSAEAQQQTSDDDVRFADRAATRVFTVVEMETDPSTLLGNRSASSGTGHIK